VSNRKERRAEKAFSKGFFGEIKLSPEQVLVLERMVEVYLAKLDTLDPYHKRYNDNKDIWSEINKSAAGEILDKLSRTKKFIREQQQRLLVEQRERAKHIVEPKITALQTAISAPANEGV